MDVNLNQRWWLERANGYNPSMMFLVSLLLFFSMIGCFGPARSYDYNRQPHVSYTGQTPRQQPAGNQQERNPSAYSQRDYGISENKPAVSPPPGSPYNPAYAKSRAANRNPSPIPMRTYYNYDPGHPDADNEGFVSVQVPARSLPPGKQQARLTTQENRTPKNNSPQINQSHAERISAESVRQKVTSPPLMQKQKKEIKKPTLQPLVGQNNPGPVPVVTDVGYREVTSSAGSNLSQHKPLPGKTNKPVPDNSIRVTPAPASTDSSPSNAFTTTDNESLEVTVAPAHTGANQSRPDVSHSLPERNHRALTDIPTVISALERLVTENPDNINTLLALRFLYANQGQNDKALEVSSLPQEKKYQLNTLLQAAVLSAQAGSAEGKDNPFVVERALEAVEQLRDKIAARADLIITNLQVCRKVDGFGRYEPIEKKQLQSGQPQSIIVYCELRNFQNERDTQGKYKTRLYIDITLHDLQKDYLVLARLNGDVPDTPSYNKRKDFFLRSRKGSFRLPKLEAGKYEIAVNVEDKIARKRARTKRYQFEVK